MRCQNGVASSPGLETQDRKFLQGIRTGLQDLTGSTNQIVHAYMVLGRGCRISRVWNNRSNRPTRYKDGAARSHGFGTPDGTCLERIKAGLQDLTGKEHQIVNAYEVSVAGSHWLGTTDRTCLLGIRKGLQDLTGSKLRSNVPITGWCHGSEHHMPTRYQDGLQDLTGLEQQFHHAYEVSGRSCRISRVRNVWSNMSGRGCGISQVGNCR